MGVQTFVSEHYMTQLVAKIAGDSGGGMRTGRSTTFQINKNVDGNMIRMQLTATPRSIHFKGNIQPGLEDLFQYTWDGVKALTPDDPPTHVHERTFVIEHPLRVGQLTAVTVRHGEGYKPYFMVQAYNEDELAFIVKRIFKVNI